jgi:hypothetical protein
MTAPIGWPGISWLLNLPRVRAVRLCRGRSSDKEVLAISRGWHRSTSRALLTSGASLNQSLNKLDRIDARVMLQNGILCRVLTRTRQA